MEAWYPYSVIQLQILTELLLLKITYIYRRMSILFMEKGILLLGSSKKQLIMQKYHISNCFPNL